MLGTTHMIMGFGAGAMVSSGAGIAPAIAGGLLGAWVALFPDIDHAKSRISRTFGILGLPFRITPHRTLTHAIWIPIVLGAVAVAFPHWITITIPIAYMTHIIGDMITPRGVPLLYPLSRRAWRLGIIRTGGRLEAIFALAMIVGIAIYIEGIM